jgi:hypothetical protein
LFRRCAPIATSAVSARLFPTTKTKISGEKPADEPTALPLLQAALSNSAFAQAAWPTRNINMSSERAPTFFSPFLPKSATFTFCCAVRTFPSLISFQA